MRDTQRDHEYNDKPLVTAIMQVFNKRWQIGKVIRRLQEHPIDEVIVIDDGSIDGTWAEVLPLLNRKNDFMIRANDLFEVRAYDRALSMARGRFAVLLQDDDLPPSDPRWVTDAIHLLESDPKLLILGGRAGMMILPPAPVIPGTDPVYTITENMAGYPGVNKYEIIRTPSFKRDGIAFQYVMAVNRAPQWVKRSAFLEEVGIDQAFVPFQCDDADSCLRAWKTGWRVGLYSARFVGLGEGGMRLFNKALLGKQAVRNWKIVYERHMDAIRGGTVARAVAEANRDLWDK